MDQARIAELLEPFLAPPNDQRRTTNDRHQTTNDRRLTADDLDKISTYIDLLLRWNARINLTAIRDPDQIVQRHFGESFFLARHLFPTSKQQEAAPPFALSAKGGNTSTESPLRHAANASAAERRNTLAQGVSPGAEPASDQAPEGRKKTPAAAPGSADDRSQLAARSSKLVLVLDLGSGAGFPALPLKIWAPEIHLTLIESNHKKAAFLREVIRALQMTSVDVIAARAESLVPPLASPSAADLPATDRLIAGHRPIAGDGPTHADSPASRVPHLSSADIVTFRAVEKFDRILPLAASFLSPQGRLALLIGRSQLQSLQTLSMDWTTMSIPESHNRALAIGESKQPPLR